MIIKENYNYKDLKRAQRVKKHRLYKRILKMLTENKNCLFITFTLKDQILNDICQPHRERIIRKFLNKYASDYVLNIDYGKTTEREHYHAIAVVKYKLILYKDFFKYGLIDGEKINALNRYKNLSLEEQARALTNHATKNSTHNARIIYSRTIKKDYKKVKDRIDFQLHLKEQEKLKRYTQLNDLEEDIEI